MGEGRLAIKGPPLQRTAMNTLYLVFMSFFEFTDTS
jgi:hypothetical protein